MLHILKALPALEKLLSSITDLGPELENISSEELPDYVTSTYNNVGKNLQVWRLSSPNYTTVTIDHILLLALVCPNLWRIQLEPGFIEDYHTKISKALESGPYTKYAPQLDRVLDIVRE
ncbi:hypothetical protein GGH92_007120 [Coemansia sp. RSA 2673]|nr:hypothetical protein GGH92_007120 [Coemansia sp. RSA 2673]